MRRARNHSIIVLLSFLAGSISALAAPLAPKVFLADCGSLLDPAGTSITSDLEDALVLARRPDFQDWVATVRAAEISDFPTLDPAFLSGQRPLPKHPYAEKGDSQLEVYFASYRGRTVFVKAVDPSVKRTEAINEIRNSLITASLRITPFFHGIFWDANRHLHLVFDPLPPAPLSMDQKWILLNGAESAIQPLPFPVLPAHYANMRKLGQILEAIGYESCSDFQTRLYPDGTAILFDVERPSFEASFFPRSGERMPSVVGLNIRDKMGYLERAVEAAAASETP